MSEDNEAVEVVLGALVVITLVAIGVFAIGAAVALSIAFGRWIGL